MAHSFKAAVSDVLKYIDENQFNMLLKSPEAVIIGEIIAQERLTDATEARRRSSAGFGLNLWTNNGLGNSRAP